jgi:energy-coupling factor transporter ATP-binding protein EcfA2
MGLLEAVDTVILVLTPAYKRKVSERKGGVYDEFSKILIRYEECNSDSLNAIPGDSSASRIRPFQILPVLLSGSRSESVPSRIESLRCLDLTALVVGRKSGGEFQVSETDSKQFGEVVHKLTSQIIASSIMETQEFISKSKHYDDYFIDLKASWGHASRLADETLEKLFVKTNSYTLVERQQVFFVVGRKGSGKSTITQALRILQSDRFLEHLEINADHYNLEALYALFCSAQYRADAEIFFPSIKAFEMTWESVVMISALQYLITTSMCRPEHDKLKAYLASLTEANPRQNDGVLWGISDLFSYCFSRNMAFIDKCIDSARTDPELFWVDVEALYNLEGFLEFLFDKDVLISGRNLIRNFTGKFLVSLDGFDDAFDSFRLNTRRSGNRSTMADRANFEIDWIRSVLSFTLRAHLHTDNFLYSRLEFCIAAPLDRFLEAVRVNRDSYRTNGRWHSIQWSGIELSILLRKRLEHVIANGLASPKNLSPGERLAYVLQSRPLKSLPLDISFDYNGERVSMPVFMYVLRHTFWRPREILLYYSRLLALVDNLKKWNKPINAESLRRCIKNTTITVIQNQFINEFKTSLINVEAVINSFKKQSNILTYSQLANLLQSVEYVFASDSCFGGTIAEKLSYLYEIGFIGFSLNRMQQDRLGASHKHAFIFNEGPLLFGNGNIDEADLAVYDFLIHPIFCEFLQLNTSDTELTLLFDWEYLHHAEADLRIRQMSA